MRRSLLLPALVHICAGMLNQPRLKYRTQCSNFQRANLIGKVDNLEVVSSAERKLPKSIKGRLNVRIDDEWYDLTNWRAAHPAGAHWIDAYNNSDATEVMYGFHSDRGIGMIKFLPRSKNPPEHVRPPTKATYAFRALQRQLVDEGWYRPHVWGEAKKLLPWLVTLVAGVMLLSRKAVGGGPLRTLAGIICLGVSNTLSGWLAHDYVHGRNLFCTAMRGYGELVSGMSTTWWSNKHNMHHALTNEVRCNERPAMWSVSLILQRCSERLVS